MEGVAHGAELVSYFRWRQAPFAQEQFHAGLLLANNDTDRAYEEVHQLALDLIKLGALEPAASAKVAIVNSYEARWFLSIQPQGQNFSYIEQIFSIYRTLRAMGLDIDIVGPEANLSSYAMAVLPSTPHVPPLLAASLERFEGQLLVMPRSGSRTASHRTPTNLAPGPLAGLLGIKVTRVESFRPHSAIPLVFGGEHCVFDRWREFVTVGEAEVMARTDDGRPALTRKGNAWYVAGWPDAKLLGLIIRRLAGDAGLSIESLPAGLRTRRRGSWRFLFNYGPDTADISGIVRGELVIGESALPVGGVAVWTEGPGN